MDNNTTLIYIEKDEKYLMLHRTKKENDINKDKWIGIGGHLENGESPEEGIQREVTEETGLRLLQCQYRGIITFVYNQQTEYMHLFTSNSFEGTLTDCDEGELAWVDKKQLLQYPLWPGDRIFLKLITEPCPFFSLKLVYQNDLLIQAKLNDTQIEL